MTTMKEFQPNDVQHVTRPVDMVRLFKSMKAAGLPVESIVPRKDGCLRVNFNAAISSADEAKTAAEIASYDPARADAAALAEWTAIVDDLTPLMTIDGMLAEIEADESELQTALLAQVRAILLRVLARERTELRALYRLVEFSMKS